MTSALTDDLPVVVIGAGPVGLAAAAHLVERSLRPLVLERGPGAGAALEAWGHVRVFSPWAHNVDAAARRLLEGDSWRAPDPRRCRRGTSWCATISRRWRRIRRSRRT